MAAAADPEVAANVDLAVVEGPAAAAKADRAVVVRAAPEAGVAVEGAAAWADPRRLPPSASSSLTIQRGWADIGATTRSGDYQSLR